MSNKTIVLQMIYDDADDNKVNRLTDLLAKIVLDMTDAGAELQQVTMAREDIP